jgi:hypothetical protein
MKVSRIILLSICCFISKVSFGQEIAATPPMGWNSYNSFGGAVHEDEVKANADYMAKNLKQYGWQYVIVDYCWYYPHPPGAKVSNAPQFRLEDGAYVPWCSMDEYGRLLPDVSKFPSAKDGQGFKPLADYVHSLGLKFGIHIMRGIPRQAVWANTKILGTDAHAADIADQNSICPWLNHMYGLKDAQAYYSSLITLYASWGVDYIKMDDMTADAADMVYHQAEAEAIHKAIVQSGRPIVLSLSPKNLKKDMPSIKANSNLSRISGDFWDNWKQLKQQFDHCAEWMGIGAPGYWPDADMLQFGKVSKRGPVSEERFSRLTEDEQRTHMTLWCMFNSPLMMGGNMPENTDFVKQLLTNKDVLDIDQHGINSRQLYRKENAVVWVSQMPGTDSWNVAFFNLGDESQEISVDFSVLGIKGSWQVKDLWQQTSAGGAKNSFKQRINPHGTALFRLSKK